MSVFINRLLKRKSDIIILIVIVFLCGLFFGFYQYSFTQKSILNYLQNLFYLNSDDYTNQYSLYLGESILFIMICTYLSTSYAGSIGILLLLFIKGMQLSFSLLYVNNTITLTINNIFIMIIEIIFEVFIIFLLVLNSIYISLYVAYATFLTKQQLDILSILNYLLNYLIITFVFLVLSLCFRVYLIGMF